MVISISSFSVKNIHNVLKLVLKLVIRNGSSVLKSAAILMVRIVLVLLLIQ